MLPDLEFSLYLEEVIPLDEIYNSCKSIKKRSESLNSIDETLTTDQVYYLVYTYLADYEDDISSVDRLLSGLIIEVLNSSVIIALLQYLKNMCHLLKNYEKFYQASKLKLLELDMDIELVLKEN